MSDNSEVTIISKSELRLLRKLAKVAWAGFALAFLLAVLALIEGHHASVLWHELQSYRDARAELQRLQIEEGKEQARMKALLESQTTTAGLLTSWGRLVMDRSELAGINAHPGESTKTGVANK